jgi:sulfur-oxidizing protein SoxA
MIALELLAAAGSARSADIPLDQRRSGYADLGRDSKAMQDDDTANPATLWVLDGETLWNQKAGAANRACADCHGDATASMKGVAARYPTFSSARNSAIDLEQRINLCRTEHQQATPLPFESRDLLALTAYIGRQSRGMAIAEASDERLKPFIDAGHRLFNLRFGQGHANGYPLYRLEWQSLGSLQRRLRNCMIGMRAEPYAIGSSEFVALELFLMQRARHDDRDTGGTAISSIRALRIYAPIMRQWSIRVSETTA